VVLKKLTVTTTATTTSTIQRPLTVAGGAPQSCKAVVSVSEQVQRLEQIQEDVPAVGGLVAVDVASRRRCHLQTITSRCIFVQGAQARG